MFDLRFELRHVDLLRIFEAALARKAWHSLKNCQVQAESVSKGDLEEASGNFFQYSVEIHHVERAWAIASKVYCRMPQVKTYWHETKDYRKLSNLSFQGPHFPGVSFSQCCRPKLNQVSWKNLREEHPEM